jgi:hypothetical protein
MEFLNTQPIAAHDSECMRTMSSDRELKLEREFIRQIADGVLRPPILPPHWLNSLGQ